MGLEPTRHECHKILSLARLPVPTLPRTNNIIAKEEVLVNTKMKNSRETLMKAFHFELKSEVFQDRANGYAIGDYKKRPNMNRM